jgi:transposase
LDARVLATLCAADLLAKVDRPSAQQRYGRMPVVARDALVRSRVKLVNAARGMLDSEGIAMPSCATDVFAERARVVVKEVPAGIRDGVAVLIDTIDLLSKQIAACDLALKEQARNDPQVKLLMTAPGVGPVVAMCFLLAIRDVGRFKSSRQVASYFGLVPSLYQSGKTNRRGGITKHGNRQGRWALTVAASQVLRTTKATALREWGVGLAQRVGRKTAVVAVARKLAGVLWAMLKHNRPFEPRLAGAVA